MSPVLTQVRMTRTRPVPVLRLITAAFAAFLFLCWLFPALESPAVVDRLRVENPTAFDVDVAVRPCSAAMCQDPRGEQMWLSLGTAAAQGDHDFREVLDQGWAWVVRFSRSGVFGGEYGVERNDLRRKDWTVTIPDDVTQRLTQAGLAPVG